MKRLSGVGKAIYATTMVVGGIVDLGIVVALFATGHAAFAIGFLVLGTWIVPSVAHLIGLVLAAPFLLPAFVGEQRERASAGSNVPGRRPAASGPVESDTSIPDVPGLIDAAEGLAPNDSHVTFRGLGYASLAADSLSMAAVAIVGPKLVWTTRSDGANAQAFDLRQVTGVEEDSGGVLRLTTENGSQLCVASGPKTGDVELREALLGGLKGVAPYFASWRDMVRRYVANREVPVAAWASCAVCEGNIAQRTSHVAQCGACRRYFADPGFQPEVSTAADNYGTLTAEKMWQPILEADFDRAGVGLVWVQAPPDFPVMQKLFLDYDLLDAADAER